MACQPNGTWIDVQVHQKVDHSTGKIGFDLVHDHLLSSVDDFHEACLDEFESIGAHLYLRRRHLATDKPFRIAQFSSRNLSQRFRRLFRCNWSRVNEMVTSVGTRERILWHYEHFSRRSLRRD